MRVPRVGIGYDVHAFADGRKLILGGVEIPAERGLDGHSDADVLVHAVMDALLGAAGLADIGHYFPNTDVQWKNASSLDLLTQVAALVAEAGYTVGNIDVALIAETPKVGPHIALMRSRLAETLHVDTNAVGIKATTHEKLGSLGRGEGIAATAVAMILPR